MNPDETQKLLDAAAAAISTAGNPFVGTMTPTDREKFAGLVAEALEFLGDTDCDLRVQHVEQADPRAPLVLTVSMPPEIALALMQMGCLCPHCMSTHVKAMAPDDVEGLNQGYHPATHRRCECGEYLREQRRERGEYTENEE